MLMDSLDEEYWNPINLYKNAQTNSKNIQFTIDDLDFNYDKIMLGSFIL